MADKIDQIVLNNTAYDIDLPLDHTLHYTTCGTTASTAIKDCETIENFVLATGVFIRVKFSNTNSANSPQLRVKTGTSSYTDAKNIYSRGAQITSGTNKMLLCGVCDFVYDGTQWHLVGNYIDTDTDTTYSFATGSNPGEFTYTPSGGSATTVTVNGIDIETY